MAKKNMKKVKKVNVMKIGKTAKVTKVSKKIKALKANKSKKAMRKVAKATKSQTKKSSKVTSKEVLNKGTLKTAAKTITKTSTKILPKIASKITPKVVQKGTSKMTNKSIDIKPVKIPKIDFRDWVTPLDDRILVQVPQTSEKMTAGGLYIPETVTDVSGNYKGKVLVVGRGHMNKKGKIKPLDVQVGDQVLFSQHSGNEIEFQGHKVVFIRESDVLGIIK